MAMAGKELSRKANPGSGLGRSVKFESVILNGVAQPARGPRQWASQMDPFVAEADGNSSHATHSPPFLSATTAEPCEYVEPGTDRMPRGGPEAEPTGNTAILMGEVTP